MVIVDEADEYFNNNAVNFDKSGNLIGIPNLLKAVKVHLLTAIFTEFMRKMIGLHWDVIPDYICGKFPTKASLNKNTMEYNLIPHFYGKAD